MFKLQSKGFTVEGEGALNDKLLALGLCLWGGSLESG
jgi:hypothetical protein